MSPGTPNQPTKSQKIPAAAAAPAPLIINQPNPINTNPAKLREPIKNTPAPQKANHRPLHTKAPNLTRNPINLQNHPVPVQVKHVPLPKQKQNPAVPAHTKAKRKKKVPPIPILLLIAPPTLIPQVPLPLPILPGPGRRAHTNPLLIQKREPLPLLIEVLTPAPPPVPGLIVPPAAPLLINPLQNHLTGHHRHRTNTHPVNPIPGHHLHLINHPQNPTAGHPRNLLTDPAADHHPGVPRVVHLLPGAPRPAAPQRKSNNKHK